MDQGDLGQDVVYLVSQTKLAQALTPHLREGPDQPWHSVRRHQQRRMRSAPHHVRVGLHTVPIALPTVQRQEERHLASIPADTPGAQDALAAAPRSQSFVHGIDKQLLHFEGRRVSLAEGLVLFPQRVGQFVHGGAGKERVAGLIPEDVFDAQQRQQL
jgi:hypothetical protein